MQLLFETWTLLNVQVRLHFNNSLVIYHFLALSQIGNDFKFVCATDFAWNCASFLLLISNHAFEMSVVPLNVLQPFLLCLNMTRVFFQSPKCALSRFIMRFNPCLPWRRQLRRQNRLKSTKRKVIGRLIQIDGGSITLHWKHPNMLEGGPRLQVFKASHQKICKSISAF